MNLKVLPMTSKQLFKRLSPVMTTTNDYNILLKSADSYTLIRLDGGVQANN